jgi:hypothetical protein
VRKRVGGQQAAMAIPACQSQAASMPALSRSSPLQNGAPFSWVRRARGSRVLNVRSLEASLLPMSALGRYQPFKVFVLVMEANHGRLRPTPHSDPRVLDLGRIDVRAETAATTTPDGRSNFRTLASVD